MQNTSDYIVSCCSTSDLNREVLNKLNIPFICFHFCLDDKWYADDLGQSMDIKDFYDAMAKGAMTKTSQVNEQQYEEFFEQYLKEGKDILHVTLSSGISGTVNSANIARDTLQEKYPDRKIIIIDSLAASSGYGLLMDKIAELRDSGMSIDDLAAWVEAHKKEVHHWFFTTDLTYLVRGGRVSKVSGFMGSLLNICPLLNVDYMGRLIPRAKCRGKKKVIKETLLRMEEHAVDGLKYSGKCFISQSDCMDDAKELAGMIEEAFPNLDGKVQIYDIGTTIGSHTGPGTIALFFWGDERVD